MEDKQEKKPLPTMEEVDEMIKDPDVIDELSEIIFKAFEGRTVKRKNTKS